MPKHSKPGAYNQLWLCFKRWSQNFCKLILQHREKYYKFLLEKLLESHGTWNAFTEKV